MPLRPGDRLGRYELLELLGQGGMGEVYRAQDTVLHRRVALKVLHPASEGSTGTSESDGHARILREARAAAGIEHTNAVAIYDVGEVDGVPFLAMELVTGRTLRAFIGEGAPPLARRIRWLVETARALGAAHRLGIVHRDVKPENVMVRDDGIVKVLDFGIARRETKVDPNAPTGAAQATLTTEGLVVGTPFYMAPEQMRGERIDGRADQFAWGVLAYELLTGALPWNRDAAPLQLVAQVLGGEIEPPRARNPEIAAEVNAVIVRAMSKSAASRFGAMEEIADALEPYSAVTAVTTGALGGRRSSPAVEEMSLAPTQQLAQVEAAEPLPAVPSGPWPTTRRTESAPPRVARRAGLLVLALVAVLAVAAAFRVLSARHPVANGAPDSGSVAEKESRMSSNTEATDAYRAGVRAMRDASLDSANLRFNRAIELDPGFAAAHLMRALLPFSGYSPRMRQDLLEARNARESLGDRDRVLLEAVQPTTTVPLDMRELERRYQAAIARYPADAELQFLLGDLLSDDDARAAAVDAANVKDPSLAEAWCKKAEDLDARDDISGARAAYAQCLKISPSATTCLADLSSLEARQGKCDEMAATSRRLITVSPASPDAYGLLAQALLGMGQPLDAVRGALRQKWERVVRDRRIVQLHDEAGLAMLTGDFEESLRRHREFEKEIASDPNEMQHFHPAYGEMLMNLEVGRKADALASAHEFLRRRAAWQVDDFAVDLAVFVRVVESATGGATKAGFETFRAGWMTREEERALRLGLTDPVSQSARWSAGYALPVATADEALEALKHRPRIPPLTDSHSPLTEEPIGRTYLLAGKLDDAIAVLGRLNEACVAIDFTNPMFATWAAFDLGRALEAKGDTGGACAAYRRVVDRWGAAKPPSLTAIRAKERLGALGCPR